MILTVPNGASLPNQIALFLFLSFALLLRPVTCTEQSPLQILGFEYWEQPSAIEIQQQFNKLSQQRNHGRDSSSLQSYQRIVHAYQQLRNEQNVAESLSRRKSKKDVVLGQQSLKQFLNEALGQMGWGFIEINENFDRSRGTLQSEAYLEIDFNLVYFLKWLLAVPYMLAFLACLCCCCCCCCCGCIKLCRYCCCGRASQPIKSDQKESKSNKND